MLHFPTSPK